MRDQFFKVPLHHYKSDLLDNISQAIRRTNAKELDDDFGREAIMRHKLDSVAIDWDTLQMLPDHREERVISEGMLGPEEQVIPVYTFEVKFTGDRRLFGISPSTSRVWTFHADVTGDTISFQIRGADKAKLEQVKANLTHDIGQLNQEIAGFNNELEQVVTSGIEARKKVLAENNKGQDVFGVPIKTTKE